MIGDSEKLAWQQAIREKLQVAMNAIMFSVNNKARKEGIEIHAAVSLEVAFTDMDGKTTTPPPELNLTEGDRIWMHAYGVSDEQPSNRTTPSPE